MFIKIPKLYGEENVTQKNDKKQENEKSVNIENKTIVGFKVLKHSETPGLGSRVTTDEYAKSVVGNKVTEHLVKNLHPDADNDIQAITGTTISVNAVLNGLNAAIDALQELEK